MTMIIPRCGIFTTNGEFANKQIDSCVRNHKCNLLKRAKSAFESYAVMEDKTIYRWIKPNDTARGNKCSSAIIDLATCSLEFISCLPRSICLYTREEDYIFVDSENTSKSATYDLRTFIDRLQKIEAILGNVEKIGFEDSEHGWQKLSAIEGGHDGITFVTYS